MQLKAVLAVLAFVGLGILVYQRVPSVPAALHSFKEDRPDALSSAQPERPVLTEVSAPARPVEVQEPTPEQTRTRSDGSSDWAVIAATYKSFTAATTRANTLRSHYGDCACSVYPKEGEGQRYYVIVASGVEHDSAERSREQAVAAGLPADTYVTKLIRSE